MIYSNNNLKYNDYEKHMKIIILIFFHNLFQYYKEIEYPIPSTNERMYKRSKQ